jgi:hypothetical protein
MMYRCKVKVNIVCMACNYDCSMQSDTIFLAKHKVTLIEFSIYHYYRTSRETVL